MVKSTNEILSEILSIITSGLPLPDIKVQLADIINNQTVSQELQEQILHYINKISEDSDAEVDLLRTFIQIFSSYNTDMHSFYQDWLANQIYFKETLTDVKTNQSITNDYVSRLNHLTLAIKDDTATMSHLMETQLQQGELMSVMMEQEVRNTQHISILTDLSEQTLYNINSLVQSVEKINDNVSKINGKMPEPGPLPPGPVPPGPVPPVPPKPPVPPVPPKPELLFYCQHCNRMVTQCPKTGRKCCSYYATKTFPVYDAKKIIRERDFNKWLNEKLNDKN